MYSYSCAISHMASCLEITTGMCKAMKMEDLVFKKRKGGKQWRPGHFAL